MELLEALLYSQVGQARLVMSPTSLPLWTEARAVPIDDGDSARIEVTFDKDKGSWESFEDMPIVMQAELVAADWEALNPRHPLSWLAMQADDDYEPS